MQLKNDVILSWTMTHWLRTTGRPSEGKKNNVAELVSRRWEPWCNVCTMRHRLVSARGNAAAYDRKYFPRSIRIRRTRDGSLLKDRHHRTWPCVRRKIPVLALQLENVPDSRNTDIHHISMIRDTISRRHLRSTEYRCYFLMASRTSSQDTPENYDREF